MPNIDHHTTHYSCPEKEAEAKRMGTYPVCCHCNNHPCQVDKEIPKAENEVYQPDVNQWWEEKFDRLFPGDENSPAKIFVDMTVAEARRRTLEEVEQKLVDIGCCPACILDMPPHRNCIMR